MSTIGNPNPPKAIEKRRCKPYANIMNKKLFMAHKSTKTFFFLTFFFHCAFESWHKFFLVPRLQDTTKRSFYGGCGLTHTSTLTTCHPSPYGKGDRSCENLLKKHGHF